MTKFATSPVPGTARLIDQDGIWLRDRAAAGPGVPLSTDWSIEVAPDDLYHDRTVLIIHGDPGAVPLALSLDARQLRDLTNRLCAVSGKPDWTAALVGFLVLAGWMLLDAVL